MDAIMRWIDGNRFSNAPAYQRPSARGEALRKLIANMPEWQRRDIGLSGTIDEETARPSRTRKNAFHRYPL